jgi:hypothetical protein
MLFWIFAPIFCMGNRKFLFLPTPYHPIVLTLEMTCFQSFESVSFPNKLYHYFYWKKNLSALKRKIILEIITCLEMNCEATPSWGPPRLGRNLLSNLTLFYLNKLSCFTHKKRIELPRQSVLFFFSLRSSCLSLPSTGSKGVYHQIWDRGIFFVCGKNNSSVY